MTKKIFDELIQVNQKRYFDSFEETGLCKILSTIKITKKEFQEYTKDKTLISSFSNGLANYQTYEKSNYNGKTLYNVMAFNDYDVVSILEYKQLCKSVYFPYWNDDFGLAIAEF